MSILTRYIAAELFFPFSISFFVLTFVLLMTRILALADLLFQEGVGFWNIAHILTSIVLYLSGVTVPMAFLLGILLCFGRLTSDSEMIALRASGISLMRIIRPVFFFCVAVFCGAFYLQTTILPQADWQSTLSIKHLEQNALSLLEEKKWVEGFGNAAIYVEELEADNCFKNIRIHQAVQDQRIPRMVYATSGHYTLNEKDRKIIFSLDNGYLEEPSEKKGSLMRIDFGNYTIEIELSQKVFRPPVKDFAHLTSLEISEQLRNKDLTPQEYKDLVFIRHSRLALAFACIVFFLLGVPLSVNMSTPDKSTNFSVAGFMALGWYLLMLSGRAMALKGIIPVELGLWLPNIVLGGLGFLMVIKLALK